MKNKNWRKKINKQQKNKINKYKARPSKFTVKSQQIEEVKLFIFSCYTRIEETEKKTI